MTDKLPPNLLALFAPRPPLRWVQPVDVAPAQRKTAKITGLAEFLPALAAYKETDKYVPTESWLQARDRKKREKVEKHEMDIKEGSMKRESPLLPKQRRWPERWMNRTHSPISFSPSSTPRRISCLVVSEPLLIFSCFADNPSDDPNIRGDAFKTLIVARLSYDAGEKDIEREFERFGPIERVSGSSYPLPQYFHEANSASRFGS